MIYTTRKQLEAARDRANDHVFEWVCEYENELENFFVKDGGAQLFTLKEFYRAAYHQNRSIADEVENDGVDVYEEDDDASLYSYAEYRVCTRRAIKRLRRLEDKINEWEARACALDCAADEYDYGISDETQTELAKFNIHVG